MLSLWCFLFFNLKKSHFHCLGCFSAVFRAVIMLCKYTLWALCNFVFISDIILPFPLYFFLVFIQLYFTSFCFCPLLFFVFAILDCKGKTVFLLYCQYSWGQMCVEFSPTKQFYSSQQTPAGYPIHLPQFWDYIRPCRLRAQFHKPAPFSMSVRSSGCCMYF